MAKKTALKKKAAPAKAKAKKSTKAAKAAKPEKKPVKLSKPIKLVKSAAKVLKAVFKILKPKILKPKMLKPTPTTAPLEKLAKTLPVIKAVKPALMTKKGKKTSATEEELAEAPVIKKTLTVVSMMEAEAGSAGATEKVEKTSKAKPIKIDRGNLADEKAKWTDLSRKFGKEKGLTYKMSESYPASAPLQHKVLGWGYILTNENDRLEVLFEHGIRMLISNYKS